MNIIAEYTYHILTTIFERLILGYSYLIKYVDENFKSVPTLSFFKYFNLKTSFIQLNNIIKNNVIYSCNTWNPMTVKGLYFVILGTY